MRKIIFILVLAYMDQFANAELITQVKEFDNLNYISFVGETDGTGAGTVNSVRDLSKSVQSFPRVKTVFILDNHGGAVVDSKPLAKEILNLSIQTKAFTNLPLVVLIMHYCDSMCIPTAMELLKLSRSNSDTLIVKIKRDAKFGFHGPNANGNISYNGIYIYFTSLVDDGGINDTWLFDHFRIFSTTAATYKGAEELIEEKFGQISINDIIN